MSRKIISISEAHYLALKQRGRFGDSFDDVVGELLQDPKKGEKRAVG
jgi:predicted CopG family antitoxin